MILRLSDSVSTSFVQGYERCPLRFARRFPHVFLKCAGRFCDRSGFCNQVFDYSVFDLKCFRPFWLATRAFFIFRPPAPSTLIAGGNSGIMATSSAAWDFSFRALLSQTCILTRSECSASYCSAVLPVSYTHLTLPTIYSV